MGLGLAELTGSAQPSAQIGIRSFRPSHSLRFALVLAGEKHQSLTIHPGRVPIARPALIANSPGFRFPLGFRLARLILILDVVSVENLFFLGIILGIAISGLILTIVWFIYFCIRDC